MNYQCLYKHPNFRNIYAPLQGYFSESTVKFIQSKVSELLQPHYGGRPVHVPDARIVDVMNSVYATYQPPTGDIYSRYIIPSGENDNSIDRMINQVIKIICDNVRANLDTDIVNSSFGVWNSTVLGDFNPTGVRAHDVIKLNRKRPPSMLFNMNY